MTSPRLGALLGLLLVAVALPATADQSDPLSPLISHAESFLHREESGGVTLDPRHFFSLPEHLRLTVVPQLAAFCDLYRSVPTDSRYLDLVERADFLVRLGPQARSFDVADGMLAYALLRAFEVTGNTAYRDAAMPIVDGFLLAPVTDDVNRSLMAGMALAQYQHLTGDPVALTRLTALLLLAARFQHADGSFDHVCAGARDVHYSAWIAMELDLIGRLVDDPNVPRMLSGLQGFLDRRVAADGAISYQDTNATGATIYYYSKAFCPGDYDTRGWVNELAYHALRFDRVRDFRYNVMMVRLANLESQGAWPDKWDFFPSRSDPSYVWSTSPRSVIRTSIIFWTLASIQARRSTRGQVVYTAPASPTNASSALAGVASNGVASDLDLATMTLAPNPARGNAWISLRLPRAGAIRLSVLDAAGRGVRDLLTEPVAAGRTMLRWDGRDRDGATAPAGVYFVRLEAEGRVRATRFAWIPAGR